MNTLDTHSTFLCLILVNGGWSTWSAWGSCSVTCAEGVSQRQRLCNHPEPSRGGSNCIGENIQQRPCVAPACPGKVVVVHCNYLYCKHALLLFTIGYIVFEIMMTVIYNIECESTMNVFKQLYCI